MQALAQAGHDQTEITEAVNAVFGAPATVQTAPAQTATTAPAQVITGYNDQPAEEKSWIEKWWGIVIAILTVGPLGWGILYAIWKARSLSAEVKWILTVVLYVVFTYLNILAISATLR